MNYLYDILNCPLDFELQLSQSFCDNKNNSRIYDNFRPHLLNDDSIDINNIDHEKIITKINAKCKSLDINYSDITTTYVVEEYKKINLIVPLSFDFSNISKNNMTMWKSMNKLYDLMDIIILSNDKIPVTQLCSKILNETFDNRDMKILQFRVSFYLGYYMLVLKKILKLSDVRFMKVVKEKILMIENENEKKILSQCELVTLKNKINEFIRSCETN